LVYESTLVLDVTRIAEAPFPVNQGFDVVD